jgi:hypothetical protein
MAMNPDTGKLEKLTNIDQDELRKRIEDSGETISKFFDGLIRPDGSPVPESWTLFKVGELVELKEHTFEIAHLGDNYIVLEPRALEMKKPDDV